MNAATVLKELKAREPVNTAGMREVGKPLNRAMRHADPGAVVALAQELVDAGGWAPRQVACELLASPPASGGKSATSYAPATRTRRPLSWTKPVQANDSTVSRSRCARFGPENAVTPAFLGGPGFAYTPP